MFIRCDKHVMKNFHKNITSLISGLNGLFQCKGLHEYVAHMKISHINILLEYLCGQCKCLHKLFLFDSLTKQVYRSTIQSARIRKKEYNMSLEKRQHIINAAMKLFVANGFHATPTSKIAKKAKVSVGTLFNYFHTKEDLIEAIYVHIKLHSKATFLELLEEKETIHDTLLSMWHAIITWGTENPEEFQYLELFCHSPFKTSYQREKSLDAYKQFQSRIIKVVVPTTLCEAYPEYVLTYVDQSLHGAIRYLLQEDVEDPEFFIRNAFDMLWHGLSYHSETKDLHS